MKGVLVQGLPVVLLMYSLYAPLELTRLIIWYSETYAWHPDLWVELAPIGLGFIGQVWAFAFFIKRWRR